MYVNNKDGIRTRIIIIIFLSQPRALIRLTCARSRPYHEIIMQLYLLVYAHIVITYTCTYIHVHTLFYNCASSCATVCVRFLSEWQAHVLAAS